MDRPHSNECPTYFRIGCEDAKRGGDKSYSNPAWHLAIHLEDFTPDEIEPEQWDATKDELKKALDDENVDQVFQWFRNLLPRCMKLVPSTHKVQFYQGIYLAYEDNRLFN